LFEIGAGGGLAGGTEGLDAAVARSGRGAGVLDNGEKGARIGEKRIQLRQAITIADDVPGIGALEEELDAEELFANIEEQGADFAIELLVFEPLLFALASCAPIRLWRSAVVMPPVLRLMKSPDVVVPVTSSAKGAGDNNARKTAKKTSLNRTSPKDLDDGKFCCRTRYRVRHLREP
jgi:hypothetical protein